MKKMLSITSHFYGAREFEVAVSGNNVSKINDKLIRLAAKLTERFAGDIVYFIQRLENDISSGVNRTVILAFREDGVYSYDISDVVDFQMHQLPQSSTLQIPETLKNINGVPAPGTIQYWLLETYADNVGRKTCLRRIDPKIKNCEEEESNA